MMGLIRHAINTHHTGIAIADATTVQQADWVLNYLGQTTEIHQIKHNTPHFPGWQYHDSFDHTVYHATKDCDIIVTWGAKLKHVLWAIDKPVVEIAQNEDQFAAEIVRENEKYVHFRVAVSQGSARIFEPKQVDRVIPNAIDPTRCCPRYGRETCRKMWGLENRKVILFLGRFVKEKNPGMLLSALAHLPEEWCVLFAGRGYDHEALVREAQRHVGGGRVYFAQPQFHVGDILAASDVYVLPSDFEGLPLALLEAWMAGVPTVCTNFSVMGELYEAFGELCTIVPRQCRSTELAQAIADTTIENPTTLERCARAQNVVWNNFTLPTVVAQWEEVLFEFYHQWFAKRARMQVYQVTDPEPLMTSKAHLKMVDTSQDSIAKWDKL